MSPSTSKLSSANFEILKKVGLFEGLKDNMEAMKAIGDLMGEKAFPKGFKLTEEGKEGDEYFILIHGEVSIHRNTPEGDSYKVVVLKGEKTPAFGEGGLLEGERRSATVVCESDSVCIVLARDAFAKFCKDHPQFALPIMIKIAQSLMNRLNQTSRDLMLLHKALMDEIRSN